MQLDSSWKLVGHIGVDAGLCWIGDPCYIINVDKRDRPKTTGKTWHEFCDIYFEKANDNNNRCVSFSYNTGHEGLGVCVPTGCGDGTYPVYAKIEDGTVAAVIVDFYGLFGDNDPDDNRGEAEDA